MSLIFDNATEEPKFRIGLNTNYYVYSKSKDSIVKIAHDIGKSESGVYFNDKHNVWVIRVKSKSHKDRLKQLFLER